MRSLDDHRMYLGVLLLVLLVLETRALQFLNVDFNQDGLSTTIFTDQSTQRAFRLRNVPGDGDCMFLAVFGSVGWQCSARSIRNAVADVLELRQGNLLIEGQRYVSTAKLLDEAARSENMSEEEYLAKLRTDGVHGGIYGGGYELTVMSNILRRPICVYELEDPQQGTQYIQLQGVFGKETFKDPLESIPDSTIRKAGYGWDINVLIVDTSPHEKHACILVPLNDR